MWWTTARSLPRSTISPISNSSSGAARTSCGTVRFPLLTENLTRTRSIRFAQTVATSFARAAATRRPWASTAVTSIRESPRSSSSDERFDPGFPRLRQVRPLRLRQDPLQFGSRGEIVDGFEGDQTAPAAAQGEAHEQGRGREPEDERAHVGLPSDSEWPEESQEGLQNEEDDHHFDDRQRRDSGDRQEQGDPVPRVESPVRAEDREDSRGGSDEQDHVADMHEQEDERAGRPADHEQEGPPRAPDPPLEGGRDQDESEEVQEDVRLRRVHELECHPGPRRGRRSGSCEQSEFEGDR